METEHSTHEPSRLQTAGKILLSLAVLLALNFLLAWVIRGPVNTWYPGLLKPPFTPPGYMFGVVWTGLYGLMGLILARIWILQDRSGACRQLGFFAGQLVLNAAWPLVFFLGQVLLIAHIWTVLLVLILLVWGWHLARFDRLAFALYLPYMVWSGFAVYLSAGIWQLNS